VLSGIDLSYDGEETPDADLRYETEGIQSGAGGYKVLKGFSPTDLLPLLASFFPNVGETSSIGGAPRRSISCNGITGFPLGGKPPSCNIRRMTVRN